MYAHLLALLAAAPLPDTGPAKDGSSGGGFDFFWILIPILLIMLFLPMFSKKEKHRQKRLSDIKKHDRVVTSGGIYGTVVALDEHIVTLEVSKDVRLRMKRTSIFDLEKPGDAKEKAETAAKGKAGAKS